MGIAKMIEILKNMVIGSFIDGDSLILEKNEDVIKIIDLFDFKIEDNEIVLYDIKNLNEIRIDLNKFEVKTSFEKIIFKNDKDEYELSFR